MVPVPALGPTPSQHKAQKQQQRVQGCLLVLHLFWAKEAFPESPTQREEQPFPKQRDTDRTAEDGGESTLEQGCSTSAMLSASTQHLGLEHQKEQSKSIFPTERSARGRQGQGLQWRGHRGSLGCCGSVLLLWPHPGAGATTASSESCLAPRATVNDMIYLLPMELPN